MAGTEIPSPLVVGHHLSLFLVVIHHSSSAWNSIFFELHHPCFRPSFIFSVEFHLLPCIRGWEQGPEQRMGGKLEYHSVLCPASFSCLFSLRRLGWRVAGCQPRRESSNKGRVHILAASLGEVGECCSTTHPLHCWLDMLVACPLELAVFLPKYFQLVVFSLSSDAGSYLSLVFPSCLLIISVILYNKAPWRTMNAVLKIVVTQEAFYIFLSYICILMLHLFMVLCFYQKSRINSKTHS